MTQATRNRAFLVADSVGIGGAPDAADFQWGHTGYWVKHARS
jgi:phosphopentomutase